MAISGASPTARPALILLATAGLAAGVAQVVLMRELMVLAYGNELSIGLLLACWLLAGALGSLAGGRFARGADSVSVGRRAVWLCLLPGPLLIAAIALVRAAPLLMAHLADLALTRAAVDALLGWLALRSGEMPGHAPEHVTCVEGGSRSSIRPRRGSWSNSRG